MRNLLVLTYISILAGMVFLFNSCSKPDTKLVINPTVNPIPYSVLVYLITPTDKSFNPQYYTAVKSCALSLQNWYKLQMGNNKTFVLNPVVVDTLTGLHNSTWYNNNNGSFSGNGAYAYHNTLYEMQQLLGANFSTTNYTYFVYVAADFGDETIPKGLAAEGLGNLIGLSGQHPNSWMGAGGHALGHAFGLPEPGGIENPQAIMSTGYPQYPNCILQQPEKDSLNASLFFKTH
jgi:hypothetical protein